MESLTSFGDKRPTRQELDAICSDIPIYFLNDECYKALTNTICLVNAEIMSKDGKVLKTKIRGGEIEIGTDGTLPVFCKSRPRHLFALL